MHQVQHGLQVPWAGKQQLGSLQVGRLLQGAPYILRNLLLVEGVPTGVPLADRGVQARKVVLIHRGTARLTQLHGSEQ